MTPLRYRHAHVHSMASCADKQRAFSGLFHTCASEWSVRRKASDKRAENEGKHLWLSLHPFRLLLCALSLSPALLPLRVHASLCLLANGSQRERLIDMCAAIASTSIHTCRDVKETALYTCTHTRTHTQMTVRHGIVRDTPVTFCHDVWLTEDGTFPFLQHVLYDYKTMAMHESTGFCPYKECELGNTILELFSEGSSFIV